MIIPSGMLLAESGRRTGCWVLNRSIGSKSALSVLLAHAVTDV